MASTARPPSDRFVRLGVDGEIPFRQRFAGGGVDNHAFDGCQFRLDVWLRQALQTSQRSTIEAQSPSWTRGSILPGLLLPHC